MDRLTTRVLHGLLQYQYGRVITYPGEPITAYHDPFAYADAKCVTIAQIANEVAPDHPVLFVLALLQSRMKNLLESFLNHHEKGFDGRPLYRGEAYPKQQIGLNDLSYLLQSLRQLGISDLISIEQWIHAIERYPGDVPISIIAELLANFYHDFPDIVAKVAVPSSEIVVDLPPLLDNWEYLSSDREYRSAVTDFAAFIRENVAWAMRACILHGSLATEDYVNGSSDFDSFAIIKKEVTVSAVALLRLRSRLINIWPFLYRIDPLQHHGIMLISEQDMHFYSQSYFPLEILKFSKTIVASGDSTLRFLERRSDFDRLFALYQCLHGLRNFVSRRESLYSIFHYKWFASTLLLAPALYYTAKGEYSYKKFTFPRIEAELPGPALSVLRAASQARSHNLYPVSRSWDAIHSSRMDDPSPVYQFHQSIRSDRPPVELSELFDDMFFMEALDFVQGLCDRAIGSDPDLSVFDRAVGHIALGFSWKNSPRMHSVAEYDSCAVRMIQEISQRVPSAEVVHFGSLTNPGISDLDMVLLLPGGLANYSALNALPDWLKSSDEVMRYMFNHPPSMIIPKRDVDNLPKLYPIFSVYGLKDIGNGRHQFDINTHSRYYLVALAELSCHYFLNATLRSLLSGEIDTRQMLLMLAGLKHSIHVLRANGISEDWEVPFIDFVANLRENWFRLTENDRRCSLLKGLIQGIAAELSIIEGIRRALPRIVECRAEFIGSHRAQVVAVLFNYIFFVTDWNAEQSITSTLEIYRSTGKIILVFPAEIAALLAYYTKFEGPFKQLLASRFVHGLDVESLSVAEEVEERRRLVDKHYEFLRSSGLQWGGLPHWSVNPLDPEWSDTKWQESVRHFFRKHDRKLSELIIFWLESSTRLEQARAQVNSGDFVAAVELLRPLLDIDPDNPDISYFLAFALHLQRTSLDEALSLYDRALQNGFDEFWARYNRGSLRADLGDIVNARADLFRAVELKPDHDGAQYLLRQVLARTEGGVP